MISTILILIKKLESCFSTTYRRTTTRSSTTQQKSTRVPRYVSKTCRQCVMVLSPDPYANPRGPAVERQWIFKMRNAEFRLIPQRTHGQDKATLTQKRLAFAGQPNPNRKIERTLQQIFTLGLQSFQSERLTTTYKSALMITFNLYNTRFKTPFKPKKDDKIQIIKLKPLGKKR
ncbi:hypothetical protein F4814DRAFT_421343 [Daldinia grandis]|nr:hypothetical protein F4814DRAFT_421343 [Daldinia grandis]